MALINRLIREAKAGGPVVVRPHEVSKVAEHIRQHEWVLKPKAYYEQLLRAGEVRMLDAPMVVRGN